MANRIVLSILCLLCWSGQCFALNDMKETYAMITVGFVGSQNDYRISYNYIGEYEGYDTYKTAATSCAQCSNSVTGLRKRAVLFSGSEDMGLSSGYSIGAELGSQFFSSFSVGAEVMFIRRDESSQNQSNATIESSVWMFMVNSSYMLFADSTDKIRPYIALGLGVSVYEANGTFALAALNSVRGVSGVPSILRAEGSFSSLVGYGIVAKTKFGLFIAMGESKELDFGVQYVLLSAISTSGDLDSEVITSDHIMQDPGAAQGVTNAGCNGASFGTACVPGSTKFDAVPVKFAKNALIAGDMQIGGVIFDIGFRVYF